MQRSRSWQTDYKYTRDAFFIYLITITITAINELTKIVWGRKKKDLLSWKEDFKHNVQIPF